MIKKYFKKVNKKNEGFTLVETLVAISIFSVSIISMMSILGGGISNTNYVKSKMTATYIAQEGIEYVRNQRDNYVLYGGKKGWEDFKKLNTNEFIGSSDPNFFLLITMREISDDEMNISSTVSWTQKSVPYSITLTEDLFNWIEQSK